MRFKVEVAFDRILIYCNEKDIPSAIQSMKDKGRYPEIAEKTVELLDVYKDYERCLKFYDKTDKGLGDMYQRYFGDFQQEVREIERRMFRITGI